MLDVKKLLTKLIQSMVQTQIVSTTYTTGTANTWVKSVASVTIPKAGLYRIKASFANSGVLGIGYSSTTNTSQNAIIVLEEHALSASIDNVFFLDAGTWSFWTKCTTAGVNNSIIIWKVLCP